MSATISCKRCNGSGHIASPSLLSGYEACPDCDANGYLVTADHITGVAQAAEESDDWKALAWQKVSEAHEKSRAKTIEECAKLMQRWSDEAAEFKDSPRCVMQANLCRNAAQAIRNLAKTAAQPPAAPVETPDQGSMYELVREQAPGEPFDVMSTIDPDFAESFERAPPSSSAGRESDPFRRAEVEAICRAVCKVENVDPDDDTFGDGCDPAWTRYADAVFSALVPDAPQGAGK